MRCYLMIDWFSFDGCFSVKDASSLMMVVFVCSLYGFSLPLFIRNSFCLKYEYISCVIAGRFFCATKGDNSARPFDNLIFCKFSNQFVPDFSVKVSSNLRADSFDCNGDNIYCVFRLDFRVLSSGVPM